MFCFRHLSWNRGTNLCLLSELRLNYKAVVMIDNSFSMEDKWTHFTVTRSFVWSSYLCCNWSIPLLLQSWSSSTTISEIFFFICPFNNSWELLNEMKLSGREETSIIKLTNSTKIYIVSILLDKSSRQIFLAHSKSSIRWTTTIFSKFWNEGEVEYFLEQRKVQSQEERKHRPPMAWD